MGIPKYTCIAEPGPLLQHFGSVFRLHLLVYISVSYPDLGNRYKIPLGQIFVCCLRTYGKSQVSNSHLHCM